MVWFDMDVYTLLVAYIHIHRSIDHLRHGLPVHNLFNIHLLGSLERPNRKRNNKFGTRKSHAC